MNKLRKMTACITNRCSSGRKPCPTPGACVISLDSSAFARLREFIGLYRLWRGAGHTVFTSLRKARCILMGPK
jgi:hypothetical protein